MLAAAQTIKCRPVIVHSAFVAPPGAKRSAPSAKSAEQALPKCREQGESFAFRAGSHDRHGKRRRGPRIHLSLSEGAFSTAKRP